MSILKPQYYFDFSRFKNKSLCYYIFFCLTTDMRHFYWEKENIWCLVVPIVSFMNSYSTKFLLNILIYCTALIFNTIKKKFYIFIKNVFDKKKLSMWYFLYSIMVSTCTYFFSYFFHKLYDYLFIECWMFKIWFILQVH